MAASWRCVQHSYIAKNKESYISSECRQGGAKCWTSTGNVCTFNIVTALLHPYFLSSVFLWTLVFFQNSDDKEHNGLDQSVIWFFCSNCYDVALIMIQQPQTVVNSLHYFFVVKKVDERPAQLLLSASTLFIVKKWTIDTLCILLPYMFVNVVNLKKL